MIAEPCDNSVARRLPIKKAELMEFALGHVLREERRRSLDIPPTTLQAPYGSSVFVDPDEQHIHGHDAIPSPPASRGGKPRPGSDG